MSYLDLFRARTFQDGVIPQDRVENRLARDFLQLIRKSPNRITIEYLSESFDAILQSGNARVGTQTERKVVQYLLTPNSKKLPEGTVFATLSEKDKKRNWIVLHREIHPYDGYFKNKVLELNYDLKYVNDGGVVKTIPAYVNGTGEFDIKEYFVFSKPTLLTVPSRTLNLIIEANDELKKDTIFLIGEESWRYVDADRISIPGVHYVTLFKTQTNEQTSSIEDQVAEVNKIGGVEIKNPYLTINNRIEIDPSIENAVFYCLNKGKKIVNSCTYTIGDTSIIDVRDDVIVPKAIGTTTVLVSDRFGNSQSFEVEVLLDAPLSIDLIGSRKVRYGYAIALDIVSTYLDLNIVLRNEEMGRLSQNNNEIKFTSNEKVGIAFIDIYNEDTLIKTVEIEVTTWEE